MAPNIAYEQELLASGYRALAGVDEAGRGCWAGPVVAAAVVFPDSAFTQAAALPPVDDSKALSVEQRDVAYAQVLKLAAGAGVGLVPAYVIDGVGIVAATRLAMTIALLSLPLAVDALLLDALSLPTLSLPQRVLVRGDSISYSIAAASIVAKVTRDRLMTAVDQSYPRYGFARHKGYGTAIHRQALAQFGPCVLHRRTFRPLLQYAPDVVAEHNC